MPRDGQGAFGAVLSADVLAAIEKRKKELGSPTITLTEVYCQDPTKYKKPLTNDLPAILFHCLEVGNTETICRIQTHTEICLQVAAHNTRKSCYIRLLDHVFDVTGFLKKHPGWRGADEKCNCEILADA